MHTTAIDYGPWQKSQSKALKTSTCMHLPTSIFVYFELAQKSVSVLEGPLSTAKYIAAVNFAKFEISIYKIVAIIKT